MSGGSCLVAMSIATAMGRSNAVPLFLSEPGARLIVTCSRGRLKPHERIAQRTLERASRTAESGMPTMSRPGIPPDVVTSTTHKTLRGPRGGLILCNDEEMYKKINSAVFPGTQGGPLMHVIAAKAICLKEATTPEFKAYARQTVANAKALAETLLELGMDLVTGGTDNHLMLTDLRSLGVTGKELQNRLDEVHITVNKNAIPNDPQKPNVTSGVRIGTPAATTRGMVEEDMRVIGQCIYRAATDFEKSADDIRAQVAALTEKYPLYE